MTSETKVEVVRRGRFSSLVHASSGAPVTVGLAGCVVVRVPYRASDGKWYVRLDVTDAVGRDALAAVGAFIDEKAAPKFSPVRYPANVVARLDGVRTVEFSRDLEVGQRVDLEVAPGPFGSWGWTLHVRRIMPPGSCRLA